MSDEIIVLDNLRQPHVSGIVGLTQNVKVLCPSGESSELKKITLRAQQSACEFKKMFKE